MRIPSKPYRCQDLRAMNFLGLAQGVLLGMQKHSWLSIGRFREVRPTSWTAIPRVKSIQRFEDRDTRPRPISALRIAPSVRARRAVFRLTRLSSKECRGDEKIEGEARFAAVGFMMIQRRDLQVALNTSTLEHLHDGGGPHCRATGPQSTCP